MWQPSPGTIVPGARASDTTPVTALPDKGKEKAKVQRRQAKLQVKAASYAATAREQATLPIGASTSIPRAGHEDFLQQRLIGRVGARK